MPECFLLGFVRAAVLFLPGFLLAAPTTTPDWREHFDAAQEALDKLDYEEFGTELAAAAEAARLKADDAIALSDRLMHLRYDVPCPGPKEVFADGCNAARQGLDRALELRTYVYGSKDWHVAEVLVHRSHLELDLEHYQSAEDLLFRALAIRRHVFGEVHVDVVDTYRDIGFVYLAQNKTIAGDEALGQALTRRARVVGSNSIEFADVLDDVALVYEKYALFPKADRRRVESRRIRTETWGDHDIRFIHWLLDYADSQVDGREEAALSLYDQAWTLAYENHGQSTISAKVASRVGAYHFQRQAYEAAKQSFQSAITLRAGLADAQDPESASFRELTAATATDLNQLGSIAQYQGQAAEAATAFDSSYQAFKTALSADNPQVLLSLRRAAEAYRNAENFGLARERFQELLELNIQQLGAESTVVAGAWEDLGDTARAAGEYATAIEHYIKTIDLLESLDPENGQLPLKYFKLASVYAQAGQTDLANQANWHGLALSFGVSQWSRGLGPLTLLCLLLVGLTIWVGVASGAIWVGSAISRKMLDFRPVTLHPVGVSAYPATTMAWDSASANGTVTPAVEEPLTAEFHTPSDPEQMGQLQEETTESGGPLVAEPVAVAEPDSSVHSEADVVGVSAAPPPVVPKEHIPAPLPPEAAEFRSPRFEFTGEGGRLFNIWIVNLLLTLVTCGVYYFWGKAKIRKYVYSQTSLEQDAFQFHGTGGELFIGWLKALPFLAMFVYGPTVLMIFWNSPYAPIIGSLAVIGLMIVVAPLALIGAFRYRLSRSSWRGIRFSFRGLAREYLLRGWGIVLLWGASFGLAGPFCEVWVRRYLLNRAWFGNTRFHFDGKGHHLFGPFMIAILLTFPTLGLYWLWYWAQKENYCWSRTSIATARFRSTLTGWKLLKLYGGNLLLVIVTLGIGWPWTLVRTARVRLENLFLEGPLDLGSIQQDAREANATAEGFADFLGFDFGI